MNGSLRARVGDLRQIASVRRITLDDGPESGVRALAFSTGGGLDFWVLADRSMDIGPLWWRGTQIGWQGSAGFRAPGLLDAESEGGRGFNRGFSGFLVTCGLTHIRQPAGDEPLHGRIPFTPARVTACGEDWDSPKPMLYAEGEIVQARYGGEALRLRRRIEAPVGGNELRIRDVVENLANAPAPLALLYHFNLGWPAVGADTIVRLDGEILLGPLAFPEDHAPPARAWPAAVDSVADCCVDTPAGNGEHLRSRFAFPGGSLPFLQLWRDLRPRAGVLSIEPCTSEAEPTMIPAGCSRSFSLTFTVSGERPPGLANENANRSDASPT